MGAFFVQPLPFTVVSANQNSIAPASNANNDEPAMVYRSSNLTSISVILDLGTGTLSYDTVAIIGSNLRAADTVQVRTGTTNTGTGNYAGTALAAFSGTLPNGSTSKAIYKLSTTRTERYVRLDFVATSHPDGYVSAQRIVIGKQITTEGVDYNVAQGFVDQSVAYDGAGWQSFDKYQRKPYWKVDMSWITQASWRSDWFPFLQWAGKTEAFLFVPDDNAPSTYQTDALFGRISSEASGTITGYNLMKVVLTVTGLAQ